MPPRPAIPGALLRQPLRALSTTTSTAAASSSSSTTSAAAASTSTCTPTSPFGTLPALRPASSTPPPLPTSAPEALAALRSQSTPSTGIYCVARLHSRSYLLHPRDVLTLPTLKPLQAPGTTLQLTRLLEVGSRDWAIRAPAADGRELRKQLPKLRGVSDSFDTIPPWVASCSLTVLEHTKSPLTHTVLKKRRKGYKKTIQNKQGWTRLRVGDVVLGEGVAPK